jgi:hypothetical protein
VRKSKSFKIQFYRLNLGRLLLYGLVESIVQPRNFLGKRLGMDWKLPFRAIAHLINILGIALPFWY